RIELLATLLKNDDIVAFLKEFNNDLASIPYFESQHAGKYEGYYHSHIHMLVRYIGLPFRSEDATSEDRTDMWIKARNFIYYIEFKRYEDKNNSNQAIMSLIKGAIDQIFETKYYNNHTDPESYNKMRYAIGCVCSTGTRKICGVGIQKFTYGSNGLEKMESQNFLDEFSY
ncbi:1235_t:CDS:1, partial [Funneliformis geosporum]